MRETSHQRVTLPRTTATTSSAALVLTLVLTLALAACGGSGTRSPIPSPTGSPAATPIAPFDGLVIELVAKGQAFSKTELEVPAGEPFRILLDNQDKNFYHNVAIAQGDTPAAAREAALIYKGEFLSGPGQRAYDVPALTPGTYWFFCQPHANMNGTIVVK